MDLDAEVCEVQGQRGKNLLFHDGHTYFEKRRLSKSKEIVWQCSRKKNCTAKVFTRSDLTISRLAVNHCHSDGTARRYAEDVKKLRLIQSVKRKALNILETPAKIINSALAEICPENRGCKDKKLIDYLRTIIYRYRKKKVHFYVFITRKVVAYRWDD